ncbi:MAG: YhjD/YihY/BrkB family envelope integrity protein, partial [Bacillota bacterium]
GMWLEDAEVSQNNLFSYFLFSLNFFIFILAYYFIPNTKVEPLSALISGLFSGTLFILSKNLYALYVQNVIAYSYEKQIYGSLSFFPFFLIWLYLIWLIALLGAVISYIFQNRDKLKYLKEDNNSYHNLDTLVPIAVLVSLYKNFNNKNEDVLDFSQIQKKIKVPAETLNNVLNKLKKNKLVAESDEGKYILQKAVETLNLWDLYKFNFIKNKIKVEDIFVDKEMQDIYTKLNQKHKSDLIELKIEDFFN